MNREQYVSALDKKFIPHYATVYLDSLLAHQINSSAWENLFLFLSRIYQNSPPAHHDPEIELD